MDDFHEETPVSVGVAPAPHRGQRLKIDRLTRRIKPSTVTGEFAVGKLLKDMKHASGLTSRQIARKLGTTRENVEQHFWRYGNGGTGRLIWFLQYAEATGCEIWVSFPSKHTAEEMKQEADLVPPAQPE